MSLRLFRNIRSLCAKTRLLTLGEKVMKQIFRVFFIALVTMAFAGCNTVDGLGKDLTKAGDKIQKTTVKVLDRDKDGCIGDCKKKKKKK